MPPLDHDRCYAAASSRDARFDGWFVTAVRTTGIYCRPSCPAITPKQQNVEFHHTAAAAQQRGFRACKRCRPDATPGSPDWNVRRDLTARAMRLIADGVVERDGVGGLARRLGYSERHLTRLLTEEVGAGPLAVARAQRAQTARLLIETTDLRLTDVAFAAGFGSVRQFNDTIREVFAASPSELRRSGAGRSAETPSAATTVSVRLPTRAPFSASETLAFVSHRAIPGLEHADDTSYRRVLDLPGGHAVAVLRPGGAGGDGTAASGSPHVDATVHLTDWADLGAAVQRLRRLLDLDADPVAVDERLGAVPLLAASVTRTPGRRAPASVDPFETAVRAVIGQQISVAGARTVGATLVAGAGRRFGDGGDGDGRNGAPDGRLTHAFPTPAALADAPDEAFSMPTARRDTIRRLADAVADGRIMLDVGVDREETRALLLDVRGIGPWTADYIVMRGLGDPDISLATDLVVRQTLAAEGVDDADGFLDRCMPWRSYAVHHLWALHGASAAAPPTPCIDRHDDPVPERTSRDRTSPDPRTRS